MEYENEHEKSDSEDELDECVGGLTNEQPKRWFSFDVLMVDSIFD